MKAPNGYGSIVHLPGRRRKPWAFRVTKGYHENGSPIVQYIGYYPTRAEAFKARDEYHRTDKPETILFEDVLEQWKEKHYEKLSEGSIAAYDTAISRMDALKGRQMASITFSELQEYVDTLNKKGSQKQALSVLHMVFKYAYRMGYIDRDVSQGLEIKKSTKSTLHFKYSADEIQALWKHAGDDVADFVLMTIYSGMRPGEAQTMKSEDVDLQNNVFVIHGGKTENARRNVPIHPDLLPIIMPRLENKYLFDFYDTKGAFYYAFQKADYIPFYVHPVTREKQRHLPHDGRHTFTSRWKVLQLDESMRRYIQGHSGEGIGEQVYLHYDPPDLYEEMCKLYF